MYVESPLRKSFYFNLKMFYSSVYNSILALFHFQRNKIHLLNNNNNKLNESKSVILFYFSFRMNLIILCGFIGQNYYIFLPSSVDSKVIIKSKRTNKRHTDEKQKKNWEKKNNFFFSFFYF